MRERTRVRDRAGTVLTTQLCAILLVIGKPDGTDLFLLKAYPAAVGGCDGYHAVVVAFESALEFTLAVAGTDETDGDGRADVLLKCSSRVSWRSIPGDETSR